VTLDAIEKLVEGVVGGVAGYKAGWRDAVFIEYYYVDDNVKCVDPPKAGPGLLQGNPLGSITFSWGAIVFRISIGTPVSINPSEEP